MTTTITFPLPTFGAGKTYILDSVLDVMLDGHDVAPPMANRYDNIDDVLPVGFVTDDELERAGDELVGPPVDSHVSRAYARKDEGVPSTREVYNLGWSEGMYWASRGQAARMPVLASPAWARDYAAGWDAAVRSRGEGMVG